jgi:hypothetical protein
VLDLRAAAGRAVAERPRERRDRVAGVGCPATATSGPSTAGVGAAGGIAELRGKVRHRGLGQLPAAAVRPRRVDPRQCDPRYAALPLVQQLRRHNDAVDDRVVELDLGVLRVAGLDVDALGRRAAPARDRQVAALQVRGGAVRNRVDPGSAVLGQLDRDVRRLHPRAMEDVEPVVAGRDPRLADGRRRIGIDRARRCPRSACSR